MSSSALPFFNSRSSIAVDIYVYVTYLIAIDQVVGGELATFDTVLAAGYNLGTANGVWRLTALLNTISTEEKTYVQRSPSGTDSQIVRLAPRRNDAQGARLVFP